MTYHARLLSGLFVSVLLFGVFLLLNESQSKPTNSALVVNQPKVLAGQSVYPDASVEWSQTDFTGGESSSSFSPPFGSSGGWSYYSSQNNTTIDGSGIRSTDGGPAELISSIYDVGEYAGGWVSIMNTPLSNDTVSVRGGNSIAAVQSAAWVIDTTGSCSIRSFRYIQVKLNLPVYGNNLINNIGITKDKRAWAQGTVSDAQTGKVISGASVTVNSLSGTTASLDLKKSKLTLVGSVLAAGQPLPAGDYMIFAYITGSYTITASAPGYTPATKNVSLDYGSCGPDIPQTDFALKKVSTTSTTTTPTTTTGRTATPTTGISITKVTLPSDFVQQGSTTTDLTKVADPKNVPNLTLEVVGKNKIVYKEPVDLSSQVAFNGLSHLDKFVLENQSRVVDVDSKVLPFLNKKATIFMYNLTFATTPKVLVDGKENPQVVSNIKYSSGTLSFDVAHFTRFEAVANELASGQPKTNNQVVLLVGLSVLLLILIGSYLGYLFKAGRLNFGSKKKEV